MPLPPTTVLKVKPVLRLIGSGQKGRRRFTKVNVLKGRRRCFRPGESGHLGPDSLPRWLPAWGVICTLLLLLLIMMSTGYKGNF